MALAALGSGPKLCRCADVVELREATARSKAEKPQRGEVLFLTIKPMIWVNYNDIMVNKGNYPQMVARIRLVKY